MFVAEKEGDRHEDVCECPLPRKLSGEAEGPELAGLRRCQDGHVIKSPANHGTAAQIFAQSL